jgi:hypothetical protein
MLSQQLLLTIFLPLIGAIGLWLAAPAGRYVARVIALAVTLITLFCAGQLVLGFPAAGISGTHFAVTDLAWLAAAERPSISASASDSMASVSGSSAYRPCFL